MLFSYSSTSCLISRRFWTSPSVYVINSLGFLSSYKERFVISGTIQASLLTSDLFEQWRYKHQLFCLFPLFFTLYEFGVASATSVYHNQGVSASPQQLLQKALRQRRTFLLQFGQRRVCTRASVWFNNEIWRRWTFDSLGSTFAEGPLGRYAYRHLARSDLYRAGLLVSHPNFYLFTYFLTNPYFGSVLQQTLHSQYRYK